VKFPFPPPGCRVSAKLPLPMSLFPGSMSPRPLALVLCATAAALLLGPSLAGAQPAANQRRNAAPGGQPPGQSARAALAAIASATDPSALKVAPGFRVELLHSVPKEEQGSWVALAVDPRGRITAADQYGSLYRVTPPPIGTSAGAKVERLDAKLPAVNLPPGVTPPPTPKRAQATDGSASPAIGAHGLLYAFGALYVMVDEVPGKQGLWRFRDTDGDDQFDELKFLRPMRGSGEHGPHGLALGPDAESIYFANGNHTDLPVNLERSRAVRWDEDHLLPRMWDARGHAKNKFAPGGYVGRTDRDGRTVELFALGFRNHYDIAFDQNGELFTYDSDMEWDQGTPWYMPTRINHVVSGGDYGWRSGAGRWPAYYADSLPAALDIGPGSPTGTVFGTGAKFPAKYQTALYACDWTYGTLYAVHFTPDGATFRGEPEEFVSGKPLPLTDLAVNPHDGALYFAVGGRRTQAALYRVTYTGGESTAPARPAPPTPEASTRRQLEVLHADGTGPEAIDLAWPHLASPDRFVRFAARVAIERQLPANWADRALNEKNPPAAVEALIALARVGAKSLQPRLLEALGRLEFAPPTAEHRLPLLRAWHLAFTRMGKPDAATCARLAAKFEPLFPDVDPLVNRELLALLVFLDSPAAVAKGVPLLRVAEPTVRTPEEFGSAGLLARNDNYGRVVQKTSANRADRQQIALAYTLRHATAGWTPALRREFFSWFPRTHEWQGGASFAGFLLNIRADALANVPEAVGRAELAELSQPRAPRFSAATMTPKGPGRKYTVDEAVALIGSAKLVGRNFNQGRGMYAATACLACHRLGGEGGSIGPELSGAGSRYSIRDLLENIIEPSKVISDQYGSEQLTLKNGETLAGRVVNEDEATLQVLANPFLPEQLTRVPKTDVTARAPFPVSMMPPGLADALNLEELKDLLAYILAGGNRTDAMFQPPP